MALDVTGVLTDGINQPPRAIAVIGMACRFPGANDPDSYWHNLCQGSDHITEVPRDRWRWEDVFGDPKQAPGKTNSRWGGFIDGIDRFDPLFFQMSPAEANFVDPQHRLFLETAWRAIEDSGYRASDLAGRAIGVYAGVSKNDYAEMLGADLPAFVSTGTVHSILANRVSYLFDLRGPSVPIDTACSSSLVALHYAIRDLLDGSCEAALVGGVNALLSPRMYISHAKSGMLSPEGRCKTFDAGADGYVRGEGVGVVLLKPLDRALADNDRIQGVIRATAVNHGGRANFLTAPNVPAQRDVILQAMRSAGIDPRSIRFIEAHGTGTPLGDPIEIEALKQSFAARAAELGVPAGSSYCALGSVKTNIGHLESAAGMAALIKALLALKHRHVPSLLHFRRLNPHIELAGSPFFIADGRATPDTGTPEPWRAGVSSFGMGGVNAHVIVEEAPARPATTARRDQPRLFVFSARRGRLADLLGAQVGYLRSPTGRAAHPDDVAFTLMFGRDACEERCAVITNDIAGLIEAIQALQDGRRTSGVFAAAGAEHPATGELPAGDLAARARAWVRGNDPGLDPEQVPGRRIALPGHPFALRSCWFAPRVAAPVEAAPEAKSFGIEIPAGDPVMQDHRVQGLKHLPAVAYLRIVGERVAADGPIEISDTYWLKPLTIDDAAHSARLDLLIAGGAFCFSHDGDLCKGIARPAAAEPLVKLAPPAFGGCPVILDHAAIYSRLRDNGLDYGESFRVLDRVHIGPTEAVGIVAPLDGDRGAGVWDAAMQVAALLSIDNGSAATAQFVPFHLQQFLRHGDLSRTALIHARQLPATGAGRAISFDIDCCDSDGNRLATFRGFTKRAYAGNSSAVLETLQLYRPVWRQSDVPSAPPPGTGTIPLLVDVPPAMDVAFRQVFDAPLRSIASDGAAADADFRAVFSAGDWEDQPWLVFAGEPGEADLLRLLGLARRLIQARPRRPARIKYVGNCTDLDDAAAFLAAAGFARTLKVENPRLELDVVAFRQPWSIAALLAEAALPVSPLQSAEWQGERRLNMAMEEIAPPAASAVLPIRRGAVCVLAGGAGGLGRIVSRWLAETFQARIVLIGRRPADASIRSHLAELGGEALYLQADCANGGEVMAAVAEARRVFGGINVVAHAVGAIEDSFILRKDADAFSRVLRPKMLGALHLDQATAADALDLFLCFSSVAAVMPNQGQADYASANAYLDHFMRKRTRRVAASERSGVSLSLSLPLLADGGIKIGPRESAHLLEEFGMQPLQTATALRLLRNAIALAASGEGNQILGITGDRRKIHHHLHISTAPGQQTTPGLEEQVRSDLAVVLAGQFQRAPESFAAGTSLRDLGLDSVTIARLTDRLNQVLGLQLKPILFFQEDRPDRLVAELLAHHRDALAASFAGLGTIAPLHRAHALIDPGRSDIATGLFRRRVTNQEFYMVDHVVDGLFNVPGACYLEMARQAGALFRPDLPVIRLVDSLWISPLSSAGPAFDACIQLRDDNGQTAYEIYSEAANGARTVHATGTLVHGKLEPPPADLPLQLIGARCTRRRTREDIYRQIHAEGLHVGPSFMPMTSIVLSESEALAALQLPDSVADTMIGYLLHPTLLTGVFQTALINNRARDDSAREFIPIAIGSLEIYGLVPASCRVHSVCRSRSAGGDVAKFDLTVSDADGRVALLLRDFTIMARKSTTGGAAAPAGGDALVAVARLLRECIAPIVGLAPDEIDAAVSFKEYGINSLMIIDLNRRVEEVFGLGLSKTLFFEYQNLAELAGYFIRERPAALPQAPAAAPVATAAQPADRAARAPAASAPRAAGAEPIAIVGMALRFPHADGPDAFWTVLSEGRDCIEGLPRDRDSLNGTSPDERPRGGYLDGVDRFDPLFFNITPREAEQIDPQERLFLQVAWHTLEDAGYTLGALEPHTVGVFVGALWQPYLELGIQARSAGHAVAPSNLLYSIANRVSYVCDFHGPSLAVDTACSSSLTALHLACQSLATGESDLALAGGVNLSLGSSKHLFLSQNRFLSGDGRCRSFGSGGDGYVPGEGVAAVLLQPLAAARAAGRQIHGVIRSTAANHGGRTHGYTVPNPRAQAAVIRETIRRAGIDARAISYLEAHGTGTELGDPIEITGLTQAFRDWTADSGFCSIGSVKSNFGHLEAAAGMAGLIKVLLQMRHRSLAPSLHASTTNPHIDFAHSPFVVQQTLQPWRRPVVGGVEMPLLAGVSSFGAGGSNSHVIIEEYIAEPSAAAGQATIIVPLSAKDADRLGAAVGNLLGALAGVAAEEFPRLAYTLQAGREAFAERVVFKVATIEDLRTQLERFLARPVPAVPGNDELLRLLRRDGDLSALVAQWIAKRNLSKLAEVWKLGVDVDWSALWPAPPPIISLPGYPFAPERHWLPMGPGRAEAPERLHPLLHRNVSTPGLQRYRSIFAADDAVFADHRVQGRGVFPAAAYMELARAAACDVRPPGPRERIELRDIVWIRACVSAVGATSILTTITAAETNEAAFEIGPDPGSAGDGPFCRGSIQWHDAVPPVASDLRALARPTVSRQSGAECYALFSHRQIEYGTSHQGIEYADRVDDGMLTRLRPLADDGNQMLVPGILDSALQATLLLTDDEGGENRPLPMPFALDRAIIYAPLHCAAYAWTRASATASGGFDIDVFAEDGEPLVGLRGLQLRSGGEPARSGLTDAHLLVPLWRAFPAPPVMEDPGRAGARTSLIIGPHDDLTERLASPFAATAPDPADLSAIDHVLWRIDEPSEAAESAGWQQARQTFDRLQTLLRDGAGERSLEWTIVTRRTGGGSAPSHPDVAACHALLRTAAAEHPPWAMRIIEISGDAASVPDGLANLQPERPVPVWRLDHGDYFRAELVPLAEPAAFAAMPGPMRQGGVYLVIGGAGGIGTAWSEWAIRNHRARIIWIGRRPESDSIRQQIDRLGRIGTAPRYVQADAADPAALAVARADAIGIYGAVHGIVHSAFVLDDARIDSMSVGQFDRVMAAKADICRAIERVFQADQPELVLFFSSVNAFAAPAGQGNYSAASCFADRFADRLRVAWGSTVKTINWGFWGNTGAVATPAYRDRMFRLGFGSVEPEDGFRALDILLRSTFAQVAYVRAREGGDDARRFFASGVAGPVAAGYSIVTGTPGASIAGAVAIPPEAAGIIADAVARALGVTRADIDLETSLADYGLDAAGLAAVKAELHARLPHPFDADRLTSEDSLSAMAGGASRMTPDAGEAPALELAQRLVRSLLEQADLWQALPAEVPAYLHDWHRETRRQLAEVAPGDLNALWQAWNALPGLPEHGALPTRFEAYVSLLRLTLPALTDIVRGKARATDVLFPGGSLQAVARVYDGNATARALNGRLAAAVVSLLRLHRQSAPNRPFSIVEIGAGTGATSGAVFRALDAAGIQPDRYVFTDLSPAFLTAAADAHAAGRPYLVFEVLDAEADPRAAAPALVGQFDLVIATNVLHATRGIRRSVGHAKALLRPNGVMLLHELTRAGLFNHLTFGLLSGWWASADGLRLQGSPLLSEDGWRDVLALEGFRGIRRLGQDSPDPGQAVFIAESDGAILQAVAERHAAVPAAEPDARPLSKARSHDPVDAIREFVRDAVAAITRIPAGRLQTGEPFEAYGVDSIVRLSLHAELEKTCGSLPKTLLFEKPSIEDVAAYLAEHCAGRFATAPAGPEPVTPPPSAPAIRATVAPAETAANEPIAIIGISGRYPGAKTLSELWNRLVNGENCATEAPADRRLPNGAGGPLRGGFIAGVDRFDHALFRLSRTDAAALAPEVRLFLETAWLTFENAGYGAARLKALQQSGGTGVFVASMYHQSPWLAGAEGVGDEGNLSDWLIPNRVSHFFDLGGPSLALNTACSGSLTAIHLACESLRSRTCAMALAGGVNLTLLPSKFATLSKLGFLASGGASRSFGRGDGFLPGEGIGAVLLKPLSQALADGDRIAAVIRGSHINHSGGRQSFYAPDPKAQARLIVETLRRAGVPAASISYVEAAANGSEMADALEVIALTEAFGARAHPCAIGSVKSNLGHLEAASGMSQVAKVVLQMQHRTLVPTLFASPRNPHMRLDRAGLAVQEALAPWPAGTDAGGAAMPRTIAGSAAMPRRAIVNSFGAGGAYAALVLEEAPPQPAIPSPARPHMFAISGPDRDALRRRLLQLQVMAADARQDIDLGALAATLWGLEAPFAFRTAIVAGSRDGLEDGFRQALAANVPDGLFHGGIAAGAAPGAESRAEDWLAGHRIVRPGPAIPLQLPPYPFDHRERFAIGQPAADLPFDLDFSKIVSGELTEAAFAALLRT